MTSSRNRGGLFILIGLTVMLAAQAGAGADGLPPIMPVSEIRPGMKGHGLTALTGPRPEKFPVEVIAVIQGWFPKGSIILVRMSGPVIDEAGVISGMSGSPVFIDGKLIGAVAYGWSFTKIPLAGVTPAEEMLKVQEAAEAEVEPGPDAARREVARLMRRRMKELASFLLSREPGSTPGPDLTGALMRAALPPLLTRQALRPARLRWSLDAGTVGEIEPLPIPLAVAGAGSDFQRFLPMLQGSGLMPVQGAAVAEEAQEELKPEPGMPVGVLFVGGDVDISGMGTLTWIDGDRIAAFGHPLFGAGDVDLPMALGRAQAVVPSLQRSFRLSSAEKIIGRIVQDRDAAIVGRLGEDAPIFPLTVRIGGQMGDRYDYKVAGYWQTAPYFTYLTCLWSSTRWQGDGNPYTLEARAQISIKGRAEPLVLENEFASWSVAWPAFELVLMPLDALVVNPFQEVEIEAVDYEVNVHKGFEVALIEAVRADRLQVEPGSDVTLYVRLRQWQGDEVIKKVPLHIPETARPGSQIQVIVCDAMTNMAIEADFDPGFFAPRSFEQLLDVLADVESNRNLIVRASFVQEGVRYAGQPLPALPPSALSILQFGGAGETEQLISDRVMTVETPWVLEGGQLLTIAIQEPPPHKP